MLPSSLLCSMRPSFSRKKKGNRDSLETEAEDLDCRYSVPFHRDPFKNHSSSRFSLRSDNPPFSRKGAAVKAKKKGEMATKVSNFSDLIQRVAASCLLHPLAAGRQESGDSDSLTHSVIEEDPDEEEYYEYNNSSEDEGKENEVKDIEKSRRITRVWNHNGEKTKEMVALMEEVFEAVAEMKKAYLRLQEAHCPWDPERMRAADVAVVGELRKLGVLRERFRRETRGGGRGGGKGHVAMLREVVAPYEAAVEDLKREVKVKEVEIENLKEKLNTVTCLSSGGTKGRSLSKRKVSCSQILAAAPTPELFEATVSQVKEASKSFTSLLLSLMREARWDIAAAVRSIEAATATPDNTNYTTTMITPSVVANHHAKYALESYVSRKFFQGFDNETFYMDGSLSSLLNPDQYHRECFTQYRDMKAMDPVELLGILPTCNFGKFCSKKYLAIVHPKMEESLFGGLEQRNQVMAGNHPRSQFYGEFLGLAKAIWLLHLLAFSLDPAPSQFEASRGAEFHPHYMESVGKISGGRVPAGQIVGFPVSPGFKLGNGSVVKARVYLVTST
ncbi:protein GRAVITROPIC IN THE LIGHT 1-like isoform X2 [Hibiscus syriacus]|uniref:protein GRAVITROPIC IN THE LIGHT 1-like isoform X2 n=1 Tax=Hibiscus syriacus TaxID=106335 RepID=UPI001924E692|nr:protein GRAVITROPIC IN THE LIGHT 1-like isoform X2 [Hibiscus syriacus]